jgi:uncharacterized protein
MPADATFITLLTASVFCGALVNTFAGFAFSPVAAIVLIGVLPPSTLIPLLMICSILVQLAGLVRCGPGTLVGRSDAMLLGGAFGVSIAVMLLPLVAVGVFQVGFGLFLAAYALLMLRRPAPRLPKPRVMGHEAAVGFAGGVIGGLTAMPGAAPVLYCDLQGIPKSQQRAIVQPFIVVMQVLGLLALAFAGRLSGDVGWLVVLALPALALGAIIGYGLNRRVSDTGFRRAVLVLLLVTGIGTAAGHDFLMSVLGMNPSVASTALHE